MSLPQPNRKQRVRLIGKRTKTAERRIRSLVRRKVSFYLTTLSIEDNQTVEEWLVMSGGWVTKVKPEGESGGILGHIKNLLKFFNGPNPQWYDPDRPVKRSYVRRKVHRGKSLK